MIIEELWREKLQEYRPTNALEQENVLQELTQLLVLASLAKAGFFTEAMFHGGTCLRILYHTRRFSEDLDFLLKRSDPRFRWQPVLDQVRGDFRLEGIQMEAIDRSTADVAVKKAFLKTDSIGSVVLVDLPFTRRASKKIRVKLEIDTNPPEGSTYQTSYIAFPRTAAITTQTLESGFATKTHALLCRGYTKGRDWYDFLWYVSRRVVPDLVLLENALAQQGPWADKRTKVSAAFLVEALRGRIAEIDWAAARADVARFLPASEQDSIELWAPDLFLYTVGQLADYL